MAATAGAQAGEHPYFYDTLFANSLLIIAGLVILGAVIALVYLLSGGTRHMIKGSLLMRQWR